VISSITTVVELLLAKLNCTPAPAEDWTEPTAPQEAWLAPLALKLIAVGGGGACVGFGVVGLGLGAGELVDGAGAGAAVVGACVACAGRAVGCRDGVGVG
jgi:hypothetical protein